MYGAFTLNQGTSDQQVSPEETKNVEELSKTNNKKTHSRPQEMQIEEEEQDLDISNSERSKIVDDFGIVNAMNFNRMGVEIKK